MSFSQLRSARSTKDAGKSYVTTSPDAADGTASSPFSQVGSSSARTPQSNPDSVAPMDLKGLYPQLPRDVQVRVTIPSGRGIWAMKAQRKGSTVCAVKPPVVVISSSYLAAHCSTCCHATVSEGVLKRCTRCRVVHYCSNACRDADWPLHKLECRALQDWAKEAPSADAAVPSDAIRCIARVLWTKQKEGPQSVLAREVDVMQSHRTSFQPSSVESHMHLAHALVRYLGLSSPADLAPYGIHSPGDLVDLLSRFSTNTITLSAPSLTPIGLVVSPLVALFNHSCDPNAVVVFPSTQGGSGEPPKAQVIALRDIKAEEEITTTYIDTTLPVAHRQASLKETYNFTCTCNLCKPPRASDVDPRISLRCPKSCGGVCACPTEDEPSAQCGKCGAMIHSAHSVMDVIRVAQDGLAKATTLQSRDPEHALRLTTNLIPLLSSAGLMPSAHPLLALTRIHLSLLLARLPSPPDAFSLDEAIRTAARAATGLGEVLQDGHPVRGIARAELGKLLAVDEPTTPHGSPAGKGSGSADGFPPHGSARLALAYGTLQRAHSELSIGFGRANEGGEVGREVKETLLSLEKEIGVWKSGIQNVREFGQPLGG